MDKEIANIIALALFALIALAAWGYQHAKLQNTEDYSVIYVDQLQALTALGEGPVYAILMRQSGNVYRELGDFENWRPALAEVIKAFNRAGIDSVMVRENEPDVLDIQRAFKSHGGKAEGKKLGGAVIRLA